MSPDPIDTLDRKAAIHRRLLDAYRALDANDKRRQFRKDLATAIDRSTQSVSRWLGDRKEAASPVTSSLDGIEKWLDKRGCK